MTKPTVCVDFNGVLDNYKGWIKDSTGIDYPPRDGVKEFLESLSQQYNVVVLTAIEPAHVIFWLCKYNFDMYVDEVTNTKPPAIAYIDDRAIRFNGDYQDTLKQLHNFKPYWEEK